MRTKARFMLNVSVGFMFVLCGTMLTAFGQDREHYGISAKAGGVNATLGDVTLIHRGATEWQTLASNDDLDSGDVVRTGATGRVEMLLNPGSYLRAAENSEFELTSAAVDALQVKVVRGSVIVEVTGADEARTLIEIATPQTKISIDRKGLYRINLVANNATEVLVSKGRATVGEAPSATVVKDGKRIIIGGDSLAATKFEKKEQDNFDAWSQQRSEELVAVNRRLSNRTIASSYANYTNRGFFGWQRGYRSSGIWIYDPFFRGRTFLPFYPGWSSPYGRGYSRGFGFPWHGHSYYSPFYIGHRGNAGIGLGSGRGWPRGNVNRPSQQARPASRAPVRTPGASPGRGRGRH